MVKVEISQLRIMLPQLEEYFGFQLYNITEELFEVYDRQVQEGCLDTELAKTFTCTSHGHSSIDVVDYVMATNDFIMISVTNGFKNRAKAIVSLCKETLKEDYKEYARVLVFMSAILNRDINNLASKHITGEYEWNHNNYVKFIRPELLQLYIARNDRGGIFHKICSITLGHKTIPIQVEFPWFEKMLDRYFHRFLGVNNVEEAKKELLTTYQKKVGNPLDEQVAPYIWGTFHLLQTLPSMASKNPKMCSRPQSRFIAEFLNIIGLIDIYETDSEAIRGRLNNYLKKFDTLEELLGKHEYKTSPNNTSQMEFY